MGSTPTIKGISRVEIAFEQSDQRFFFVPCPDCGEFQRLLWRNVIWPEKTPEKARYVCPHCGVAIEEDKKLDMVSRGEWRASKAFTGIAGFHISELYSTFSTWREMAVAFVRAEKSPETLKTWVNTSLGETWEEARDEKDPAVLKDRAEDYDLGTVPAGALILTMGVDVQGDRLEAYTWGYGAGEEAWCVDFRAFYGDPARPIVWEQLLEHLSRPLRHELGTEVIARTVAIDTGGLHTQTAYAFCRQHAARRTSHGLQQVIAIKGASQPGKAIIGKPTAQDIDLRGDRIAKGIQLWPVGSSAAKQVLYARLNIDTPGPGFVHTTKSLPEDFWDQLISERLLTKYVRGYPMLEWQLPKGRRNEALDCAVYAYAAALQLGMNRMRAADWTLRRDQIAAGRRVDAEPPQAPTAAAPAQPPKPAVPQGPYGRKKWATNW
jgi:phage terminase large subunit GpA-like protein